MFHETDVLVIGGGPAGLAAGMAARMHGLRALVVDRDSPPVDKACGEGLMPDSLEVLHRLGVALDGYATREFRGIRFVGSECSVAADFPRGRGRGIRRVLLHQALLEHAYAADVEMLWRVRVGLRDDGTATLDEEPVRYKWLIGADGQNSAVRQWAGLDEGRIRSERIGLRRHFRVKAWNEFVEIHWSSHGQAYVTPVGENEICVALISRERFPSFYAGLTQFRRLAEKLGRAEASSQVRGSLTVSRRLKAVTRGNVALVGDASGSVDAITGEGLAMGFRQALALGEAMASEDLSAYQQAHREISVLPEFMARSMLLMDSHRWLRRQALRAFARKPRLFEHLLKVHVGEAPLASLSGGKLLDIGWQLLTATGARLGAPEDWSTNAT